LGRVLETKPAVCRKPRATKELKYKKYVPEEKLMVPPVLGAFRIAKPKNEINRKRKIKQ
jgi:hypothetical protein